MDKKQSGKKMVRDIEIISIITVAIFLLIYLVTIISVAPEYYTEMAERGATANFNEDMQQVSSTVEDHYSRLYEVVDQMAYADSREAVAGVLQAYEGDETVGALRYVYRDTAYDYDGTEVVQKRNLDASVVELAKRNEVGCTPIYYDEDMRLDCIAFFIPVRGSMYIDGLISVVPAVDLLNVGETLRENTSVVALVEPDGYVWSSITAQGFEQTLKTNLFDFVQALTDSKEHVDTVTNMVDGNEFSVTEIKPASIAYTIVVEPVEALDDHVYLVTFSRSADLVPAKFDFISHIAVILIVAIVTLIVGASFAILFVKKVNAAVASVNLTDQKLDCPNVEGFKKNVTEILEKKKKDYAIVVYSLNRFHFIEDKFGSVASVELLKHIKEVLTSVCGENETFGYAGDGKFLLLEDFRSEAVFHNRLLVFEGIVNQYELLKINQIRMQVSAGVYLVTDAMRRPVADMIDCATIVCDETDPGQPYAIYTEAVRETINRNEHLEARMEAALTSNEFHLFLQPKYNVERDEVDSAEALVRWFDYQKGDYRYPAEFIGLFESNGFIVEMDHFIYLEVLRYLSEAKARGDKVVPISVNVSRVTAANADFVNFYVGNKRRYNVEDNLITLEFTESYATEDYKRLAEIINALHAGGIRCSIDDFGEGYSSFRIMKELRMDELKLDRLFLAKGVDAARDDMILATIIELAQNCGMTVVMEGVETKAMYDRVVNMGIGVIQGYYYAKAIPVEEFKIFVKTNTSIRYKAVVK